MKWAGVIYTGASCYEDTAEYVRVGLCDSYAAAVSQATKAATHFPIEMIRSLDMRVGAVQVFESVAEMLENDQLAEDVRILTDGRVNWSAA